MKNKYLFMLASLLLLNGCIEKFDPDLSLNTSFIVFDGIITDSPETQRPFYLTISTSVSLTNENKSTPIEKAKVEIIINNTERVQLKEIEAGYYHLPDKFNGKVGNTYQLELTTSWGRKYQSSIEKMPLVPPITNAFETYEPEGPSRTADGIPTPTTNIYVDFQDPPTPNNNYMWRWKLYEELLWCITCKQGYYEVEEFYDYYTGECVKDLDLDAFNLYDYPCAEPAWDISYSDKINIFTDIYSNGTLQKSKLVSQVPIFQKNAALINIEQLSLTNNAYRYFKLFQDQTQNTGTIADTPPSPLSGNIRNLDDSKEQVVGYFTASSVNLKHYKLIRDQIVGGRYQGLFYYQNKRFPNLPPGRCPKGVVTCQRKPSALCFETRVRTCIIPKGWNQ